MTRPFSEWLDLMSGGTTGHPADLDTAYRLMTLLYRLGAWKPGHFIVDVGSGNGPAAVPLAEEKVRYLGLEPVAHCVEFCRRVFAPYPHLRFEHVDWQNEEYNPNGLVRPEDFRIPVEDGTADFVLYVSIFTHLERMDVCRHYLRETWRALKPGGQTFITWFRHPPNDPSANAARSVFPEWEIIDAVKPFTLAFSTGGCTASYHDQWQMLLRK